MSDDKVIDIRTRKAPVVSEDVIATAVQLIHITDARDIAGLLAHLLHDTTGIPLLEGAPDTPDVRDESYEIFCNAAADLDRLTDSFKNSRAKRLLRQKSRLPQKETRMTVYEAKPHAT